MQTVNEQLWQIVEPVVVGLGYQLVGIEHLKQGRFSVVRVLADTQPEVELGISLDQCAEISQQLSAVLDVEQAITGAYNLEVSSPGVDRPIFREADFNHYIGEELQLRLYSAINSRRKLKGHLLAVEANGLLITFEDNELAIPFDNIDKANLIAKLDFKKH